MLGKVWNFMKSMAPVAFLRNKLSPSNTVVPHALSPPGFHEVSVNFDATYLVQGAVCAGPEHAPSGKNCPPQGAYDQAGCHEGLWSYDFRVKRCIAPEDATCELIPVLGPIQGKVWGCVFKSRPQGFKRPQHQLPQPRGNHPPQHQPLPDGYNYAEKPNHNPPQYGGYGYVDRDHSKPDQSQGRKQSPGTNPSDAVEEAESPSNKEKTSPVPDDKSKTESSDSEDSIDIPSDKSNGKSSKDEPSDDNSIDERRQPKTSDSEEATGMSDPTIRSRGEGGDDSAAAAHEPSSILLLSVLLLLSTLWGNI